MPRRQIGGYFSLVKTAGNTTGFAALGTQWDIPILSAEPINPLNVLRPETINSLSTLNQRLIAKRTPAFRIRGLCKSVISANLLREMFIAQDTNGDASEFTGRIFDGGSGTLSDRQFQGAKCVNLLLEGSGVDPRIPFTMDYVAIRADGDVSSATTFAAYTKDYGTTWGAAHTNWNSTATDVNAWTANIGRITVPQYFADGTLFAARIKSGPVRGNITLLQDPDAATVPTVGITLRLGTTGGTDPAFGFAVDLDNIIYPTEAGPAVLGNVTRLYTLADSASANGTVLTLASW